MPAPRRHFNDTAAFDATRRTAAAQGVERLRRGEGVRPACNLVSDGKPPDLKKGRRKNKGGAQRG